MKKVFIASGPGLQGKRSVYSLHHGGSATKVETGRRMVNVSVKSA